MLAVLIALVAATTQQTDKKVQELYRVALPSVVTVFSEDSAGTRTQGTAFLAIRDGIAVTAWHVVKDSRRVTVRFSDGEEFESTGLIDKDERRDVALIRVRVAGRPMLPLSLAIPEVGSRAYVIGAPQGLDFSLSDGLISQIRKTDGIRKIQFTCAVSPGNSGGPLLSASGQVIAVVSSRLREGEDLNFAIPASYVAGLDDSLATQRWANVQKDTPRTVDSEAAGAKHIADALMLLWLFANRLHYDAELVMGGDPSWLSGLLLEIIIKLKAKGKTLEELTLFGKQNSVRNALAGSIGLAVLSGEAILEYAELSVRNIRTGSTINQFVATYRLVDGLESIEKDLLSEECSNIRSLIPPRLIEKLFASKKQKGWTPGEMERLSRKRFAGGYPLMSRLAYDIDATGYVFGFLIERDNPARLFWVQKSTPPWHWGFKYGDVIKSVEGISVTSFEDAKMELIRRRGRSEVVVMRDEREHRLIVNVSKFVD